MTRALRRPSRRPGPGGAGETSVGRELILRAASHVFERVGFEAATVRAIAAEAGVTAAALYHHFDGREGLVLAACEPKLTELKARLEALARAAPGPMNHALAILETTMAWALQNLDIYELLFAGTAPQGMDKVWRRGRELEAACLSELEAALTGAFGSSPRDRPRVETGARALWAAANGVMCLCLRLGCPRPVGALLSAAVEPLLREMISTWADPAGATVPSRSFAVH